MAVKVSGVEVVSDSRQLANISGLDATTKASLESGLTNVNAATLDGIDSTGFATAAQGVTADSALQPEDIGVSVQAYNASTVVDAAYVHTDNNYTAAEKNKLAGIEAGATADQTKTDIDALGIDAATLGGNNAAYFTGYTDTAVANLVASAPTTLDTLNELAAALGDDPDFATTVSTQIGTKLDAASYTAADVLTKIKTVDGSGSGLDADLLDGNHATAFATAAQGSLADSALQAGDNISSLTNDAGYTTNVGDITGVTAGSGLTGGGTSGSVTVSHADTSLQASVDNSGATVIQDVTLDTYGHVTALGSTTLTASTIGAAPTDSPAFTGIVTVGNIEINQYGNYIQLGSASMYYTSGNNSLTVNRGVVATSFTGDGSGLTNLPASAPTSAQVGSATAGLSVGAVGTYALMFPSNLGTYTQYNWAPGYTLAGSSLVYLGASYSNTGSWNGNYTYGTGTWRLMSRMNYYATSSISWDKRITLWLRIS